MTETPKTLATQIIDAFKEAGLELQSAKRVQGLPRVLGRSADGLTTIELVGPLNRLQRITLHGATARDALPAAARNGRLMALLLALVAPLWKDRRGWLVGVLRNARRQPRVAVRVGPVGVTFAYHHKTSTAVLSLSMGRLNALPAHGRVERGLCLSVSNSSIAPLPPLVKREE